MTTTRRISAVAVIAVFSVALAGSNLIAGASMNDQAISDAVEDELVVDPAVFSYAIDVSTTDGIVTLEGNVDNILASDRAASIARTVKGVRAVVNEIDVKPAPSRTNDQIRRDIMSALLLDPAADSYEVTAKVADQGIVTLTGTVDSWQERRLAGTVAKGVSGVTALKNDIVVNPRKNRPDSEVEADIDAALRWDTLVDNALINVKVDDGEVTLTGTVGSAAEKNRAFGDAWVAGVSKVDDSGLDVKRWARDEDLRQAKYVVKSDEAIDTAIEDALAIDPRVNSFNVTTDVSSGVATLRGDVDNLRARRAAAEDASLTVGVLDVRNRIKVKPAETLSDSGIESRIEGALKRDPIVNRFDVSVEVRNGVASLYGTVDTPIEKSRADEVTSAVAGVIKVNNFLGVREGYMPYIYDPYVDGGYIYPGDWHWDAAPYVRKSDTAIRKAIESQFWWSPFVDADQVKVSVDNGVATLRGTVDTWSERRSAVQNALEGGAVGVRNDLKVRTSNGSS